MTGRPPDDPWLLAVCQALRRERIWDRSRRSTLVVSRGAGEMFHVTATSNRESIKQHGLDWRRMAASYGIAGSRVPELEAIFLCESREDVSFFTRMARTPSDVWAVGVDRLWMENGPDGWVILLQPVPRDRVCLVERDIPVTRDR